VVNAGMIAKRMDEADPKPADPAGDQDGGRAGNARRQRRTQADRSEETRRRTMDAAVACLCRDGYNALSTSSVAVEAGLTRGAILYHFPTRTDLILAVADEVVHRSSARRRQLLMRQPRGQARFRSLTDVSWEVQQEPEATALLEILIGSRADKEMVDRLPTLLNRLEAYQLDGVLEITHDLGLDDDARIQAMVTLHQAALRGLSIELLIAKDRRRVEAAFDLLKFYKDILIERLFAERDQGPSH